MGLDNDEILSYQFDMAIMARGFDNESEQMKRARSRGNPQAAMSMLTEQLKDRTVDSDSIF